MLGKAGPVLGWIFIPPRNDKGQLPPYEGNWPFLRRERDSNPRYVSVNTLSKRARSATLPPLQKIWHKEMDNKIVEQVQFFIIWVYVKIINK